MGFAESDHLLVGVVWVTFDLVDYWCHLGGLEEDLEVFDAKVGDADRLDLATLQHLLHLCPGIIESGPILSGQSICLAFFCSSLRPVHQIRIDVVDVESIEGGLQCSVRVMMLAVGQLCGDEDFFARNFGSTNSIANLFLIACSAGKDGKLLKCQRSGNSSYQEISGDSR